MTIQTVMLPLYIRHSKHFYETPHQNFIVIGCYQNTLHGVRVMKEVSNWRVEVMWSKGDLYSFIHIRLAIRDRSLSPWSIQRVQRYCVFRGLICKSMRIRPTIMSKLLVGVLFKAPDCSKDYTKHFTVSKWFLRHLLSVAFYRTGTVRNYRAYHKISLERGPFLRQECCGIPFLTVLAQKLGPNSEYTAIIVSILTV